MNFEIINHGARNAQYFLGCDNVFTKFDHVVTGAGNNAVEAYNDAVKQVYQILGNEADKLHLPKQPRGYGITKRHRVSARSEDFYWYVSIRFKEGRP